MDANRLIERQSPIDDELVIAAEGNREAARTYNADLQWNSDDTKQGPGTRPDLVDQMTSPARAEASDRPARAFRPAAPSPAGALHRSAGDEST